MDQATYVRTTTVPLEELTPFPGNGRRGDPAVILASLVRTGQFRSLIVRELDGGGLVVLAGNHTLQAPHRGRQGPAVRAMRRRGVGAGRPLRERRVLRCHRDTLTGNVQLIGGTLQFSRNNVAVTGVAQRDVTGLISGAASSLLFDAGWGGGGNPPATNDAIYQVDVLDGATVLATSTVNLANGSGSAGAVVAQPPLAFTAPASGTVTVRFMDRSTGGALNRDLVITPTEMDTEGTQTTAVPFLRLLALDCTRAVTATADRGLHGTTPYTLQGKAGACSVTSSGSGSSEPCPQRHHGPGVRRPVLGHHDAQRDDRRLHCRRLRPVRRVAGHPRSVHDAVVRRARSPSPPPRARTPTRGRPRAS